MIVEDIARNFISAKFISENNRGDIVVTHIIDRAARDTQHSHSFCDDHSFKL